MHHNTLSPVGLLTILCSASLTTSRTTGLPSSVLYAPTPRLSFSGLLSALKASVTPRMASGGACVVMAVNGANRYPSHDRSALDSAAYLWYLRPHTLSSRGVLSLKAWTASGSSGHMTGKHFHPASTAVLRVRAHACRLDWRVSGRTCAMKMQSFE